METDPEKPENSKNERPRSRRVYRFRNQIRMTPFERKIFERIKNGEVDEGTFIKISADEIAGNFLIILANPHHPRNNWSCLLQRIEYNGVAYYQLAHEIPMAAKDQWPIDALATEAPRGGEKRKPINPQAIDWRENDANIARQVGLTRERVRQLRLESYLWSQVNWDRPDEEIAREMGDQLGKELGKSQAGKCGIKRVRRWRAMKDWLLEHHNHLRRSDEYHQPESDARERLKQMDTKGMTLDEIARSVQGDKEWVKSTLKKLGKSYQVIVKKHHSSKWHWERVTQSEWKKLTSKEIAEIVTDDEGNHPSEAVVNNYRKHLGYGRDKSD